MKAGAMLPAVLGMAMLTTAANAQDYWTSFYAGISAGFGSGEASYESQNINFFQWEGGTYDNVLDGGLFGGQAGYTHQFGSFVLGVEGQLLKSNLTGNHDFTAASHDTTTAIDWLGLLTLKAGVAVEPALLYVKGGYAGASITAGQEIYAGFDARTWSDTQTAHGYAIGAGAAFALTEAIAFNLDYNFVDLGTVSFSGNDAGGPTTVHTEIDGSFQAHVVTAGLNLRF